MNAAATRPAPSKRVIIRTVEDARAYLTSQGIEPEFDGPEHCLVQRRPCGRCGGSGRYAWGTCWGCSGVPAGKRRRTLVNYARSVRRSEAARDRKARKLREFRKARDEQQRQENAEAGYGSVTARERRAMFLEIWTAESTDDLQVAGDRHEWKGRPELAAVARRVAAEKSASSHVGEVGERREFDLTVQRVSHGRWSAGFTMVDSDGNVFVWWTNAIDAAPGDELTIRATIKRHDAYRGQAQTVISNGRVR